MAMLSRRDLEQIEVFLRGLYKPRRVQPLIWYVLTELPKLVGTSQTSWNIVAPAAKRAEVIAWPEQADHDKYQSALARHAHEHPLIVHFLRTGNPEALKLSDFLSTARFHNSALYAELYRGLRYEDQIAMNLQPRGPQWDTLVVARDRRTFSERDRDVLNLLRQHIAQAYRQARSISRLMGRLDSQRTRPASSRVELDHRDTIVRYPARAQQWIARYFDDLPQAPGRLPTSVERWLMQARAVCNEAMPGEYPSPLVVRRCGRRFVIRLLSSDEDGRTQLWMEERTEPHAVGRRDDLRLTSREWQVLLEVEKGKHNDEIAVELSIQPRTVKKHLEHIFDKLGVDNRTAAVARLHEAGGQVH